MSKEKKFIIMEKIPGFTANEATGLSRLLRAMGEPGMPEVPESVRQRLKYFPPEGASREEIEDYDYGWRAKRDAFSDMDVMQIRYEDGLAIHGHDLRLASVSFLAMAMSHVMEESGIGGPAVIRAATSQDLYDWGEPFGIVYAVGPGIVKYMDTDRMGELLKEEVRQEIREREGGSPRPGR